MNLTISILFVLLSVYVSALHEIHCGDSTIRSDTIAAIDGCAYYSFTVTPNITDIWLSTCGSEFDTYQYVLNATGHIIKKNDDSDECGRQSVIHLSEPILSPGIYTLNLTGWNGQTGKYALNMYCNDFNISLYPALKSCNNIFGNPIDICLPYDDTSTQYRCDDNGYPWQNVYNSTDCTGDIVEHRSKSNATTYTCDADRDCDVISITGTRGINCSHLDTQEHKLTYISNLCLPGGATIFCTNDSLSIQFYKDEYCTKLDYIDNFTMGCNEPSEDEIVLEVTNISCPAKLNEIAEIDKEYYVVIIGIIGGVFLIVCTLFVFGWYRYKMRKTINYRSKMKVYKEYLLDDDAEEEMSVNSTYSNEGRTRNYTDYLNN